MYIHNKPVLLNIRKTICIQVREIMQVQMLFQILKPFRLHGKHTVNKNWESNLSVYQRIVDTIYCYKNRSCKLRLAGLNILKITTMKKIIILIFLIGLFFELKAQRSNKLFNVDKTMLQISDSSTFSTQTIAEYINLKFFTQSKKARAIFIWISDCDSYCLFSANTPLSSRIYAHEIHVICCSCKDSR